MQFKKCAFYLPEDRSVELLTFVNFESNGNFPRTWVSIFACDNEYNCENHHTQVDEFTGCFALINIKLTSGSYIGGYEFKRQNMEHEIKINFIFYLL